MKRLAFAFAVAFGVVAAPAGAAWYPGFNDDWFGYARRGSTFYDLYYDTKLLDRPGLYCTIDDAQTDRIITVRAVCKDDRYSAKQNKPRLLAKLVHDGDSSDTLLSTCRDKAKRYARKMVLTCTLNLP